MTTPDRESNKRRSYRFPVSDGQEAAELTVRRRRYMVQLVNESSGGFAVLVDQDLRIKPNDKLELLTNMGRIEVRVAYVSELPPKANQKNSKDRPFRIGLERLGEIGGPIRKRGQTVRQPGPQSSRTPMSRAVILGMMAVMILIGAAAVLAKRENSWLGEAEADVDRPLRRPGPTLAEAAGELDLTPAQQERIRQIAEMTSETFADLDAQCQQDSSDLRDRKRTMLLEATRREVWELLGEGRRKQWKPYFE